jgi:hypothetical protein
VCRKDIFFFSTWLDKVENTGVISIRDRARRDTDIAPPVESPDAQHAAGFDHPMSLGKE